MDPQVNPFAVLSLIAAPAILTNACSVLAMSTSNRLARAADRTRELSKQLEESGRLSTPDTDRRLGELTVSEQRTLRLVAALRSIYLALGSAGDGQTASHTRRCQYQGRDSHTTEAADRSGGGTARQRRE